MHSVGCRCPLPDTQEVLGRLAQTVTVELRRREANIDCVKTKTCTISMFSRKQCCHTCLNGCTHHKSHAMQATSNQRPKAEVTEQGQHRLGSDRKDLAHDICRWGPLRSSCSCSPYAIIVMAIKPIAPTFASRVLLLSAPVSSWCCLSLKVAHFARRRLYRCARSAPTPRRGI